MYMCIAIKDGFNISNLQPLHNIYKVLSALREKLFSLSGDPHYLSTILIIKCHVY